MGADCPTVPATLSVESDAMHGALVQRPDALEGCIEGSEEEHASSPPIEAYEELARGQGGRRKGLGPMLLPSAAVNTQELRKGACTGVGALSDPPSGAGEGGSGSELS